MPLKLTMIPKPSVETTPKKSGREETLKNTKKTSHRKSKQRQSNSPSPTRRRHHDTQNGGQDPFSITNYIQDQVHTAVRKIPGVQWFTDNVSHPINVAREKLDRFDESLSPKRSHADGSWLYPKGRETSRKQAEIDIDSLKRSHKKKVKKERRKMKKASLVRDISRTEMRGEFEGSYGEALDDSLADLAAQGSEDRLFTIEDVNVASGRLKKKYRPRKLLNLTSNFDDIQDASVFSSNLPTRNEFKFTPRLLKYESETQSGTVCTVANPIDFCRGVINQNPQETRENYMAGSEEGVQVYEDEEIEPNKDIKLSWYPATRNKYQYDSSFDGHKQKRKFKKDVHFIGIAPYSSSEETITSRRPSKRKLVRDNRDESNHRVARPVVRPLQDEQVFETDQPIRKFTSQVSQEEMIHNGLNDFSDENFLSMPKFVKVLPGSDDSNCLFPMSFEERQSSARKYPKPRMFDEFEGLFVGQQDEQGASNDVHENEYRPEEFLPSYVAAVSSNNDFSSMFSRKYPKPRMEDEYEGLSVGQNEEMGAINDEHEIEFLPEECLPTYVPAVSSHNGFSSMFSRKYPKPRMEDEFEGRFVGLEEEVDDVNDVHDFESNPEEFMPRYVQVMPSSDGVMFSNIERHQCSARTFQELCKEGEFEDIFFGHTEGSDIINDAQEMENNREEIDFRYGQVFSEREVSFSTFSNRVEQEEESSVRKYLLPRMQDEFDGELLCQNEDKGFTIVDHESDSHRKYEDRPKYVQALASNTGAQSVFSILDEQSNSASEYHSSPSLNKDFDSLFKDQSEGVANDVNMHVNPQGTFPVFLLPSARKESAEEEPNSTPCENKFQIFELRDASVDIAPICDGNIKQCDQMENVSNRVLERNKLRNRTYEMKHEDTDEEQNDGIWEAGENSVLHGKSEIGENSERGQISEFGENSETGEDSEHDSMSEHDDNTEVDINSEVGEKLRHGVISEFSENSEIDENAERATNSELEKNSDIGEKSGFSDNSDLCENSEIDGLSEMEENSEIGEISELCDISENSGKPELGENSEISENSKHGGNLDDGKNVDMPGRNMSYKEMAEVANEDISDHNDEAKSKDLPQESVTSDITEEADHQELKNPGQFLRARQIFVEKIDRFHGDLSQLGSDIEGLDSINNRQPTNKNNDRVKGKAMASSFGLPPHRARKHRFRDNIMSPPSMLRRERRKNPVMDTTETNGSGELVNSLYKALIRGEPSPSSTPKASANTKTKTAASLGRYQRQTGRQASSGSKMRKQVDFASHMSKKDDYSTDQTTDSEVPQKIRQDCLSPHNARFSSKLNFAVTSIPDMPSVSGLGIGDDTLITEKTSTSNATSEVVVLQQRDTPQEIFSQEENPEIRQEQHKNVLAFEDNRESDEAKETASECGASNSDLESRVDEREIGNPAARRSLIARFLIENNLEATSCDRSTYDGSIASQEKSDLEAGVSCDEKRPKWYHHFIPGKRLARVEPTPGCIFFEEPTPKPTPKWTPLPRTLRHLRSVPVMYGRSFGWLFKANCELI